MFLYNYFRISQSFQKNNFFNSRQHLEENETENEKHQVKEQNDPKHSCINSNEDYIESEIQRRLEKRQKLNNLSEIQ